MTLFPQVAHGATARPASTAAGVMLAVPEITGGIPFGCVIELSPSLPCPTASVDDASIVAVPCTVTRPRASINVSPPSGARFCRLPEEVTVTLQPS